MTQRDIAKDKEFLSQWPETLELTAIPLYWIAQYEAAQARFEIAFENNVRYIEENERLQARISELEALLHPNNRPDVVTRLGHDTALETVFRELEELRE